MQPRFGPRLLSFRGSVGSSSTQVENARFIVGAEDSVSSVKSAFWRHVSSQRKQGRSLGALLGAALLAMPPALLEAAPSLLSMAPAVLAMAPAMLSGCADSVHHDTAPAKTAAMQALSRQDVLWLQRVSFGIDSTSVEELHRLGRAHRTSPCPPYAGR